MFATFANVVYRKNYAQTFLLETLTKQGIRTVMLLVKALVLFAFKCLQAGTSRNYDRSRRKHRQPLHWLDLIFFRAAAATAQQWVCCCFTTALGSLDLATFTLR
jgi:hypothetical protein